MSEAPERIWGGVYTSEITTYKPLHRAVGYVREDLYRAAKDELARLREAQAWQPIETAPRDGTQFLALWPHPDHDEKSSEIRTWYWEERWLNPYESSLYTPPPTHWMPLPEAPKETDK